MTTTTPRSDRIQTLGSLKTASILDRALVNVIASSLTHAFTHKSRQARALARSVRVGARGVHVTPTVLRLALVHVRTPTRSHAVTLVTRVTRAVVRPRVIVAIGVQQVTASVVDQTFIDIFAAFGTDGFSLETLVARADERADRVAATGVGVTSPVILLAFVDVDAKETVASETH